MEVTDELVALITKELIKRLEKGELSKDLCKTVPSYSSQNSAQSRVKKRIISENELKLACPQSKGTGQTFSIASNDIITPLAMDYVQKMQIIISKS
jgi:excinuclease UvrABC ATPase subunit